MRPRPTIPIYTNKNPNALITGLLAFWDPLSVIEGLFERLFRHRRGLDALSRLETIDIKQKSAMAGRGIEIE
eukprot:1850985-Pyramimonas_sp.AAC.1